MPTGVPEAQWSVRPPAPPSAVAALSRALQVPPALAALLWSRGLRDEAPDHLAPALALSPNPALVEAAKRLAAAVRSGKRILVHGDYDADGISGTAVLYLGLQELGADVAAFIPDRLTDGYGVAMQRVPEHIARADLFITVDCGVTNLSEIAALQAAGVEVIVTDHHTPGGALPDCLVVHPGLSPAARHGLPELTGAGVAFHLLWALHTELGKEAPLEYADLATIGTIADVAPLLGENRALIREGLARLADSRWPGLRASVAQARLSAPIDARSVAFVLAPRLNAAGRLGEADIGLELLTTRSERRAAELAIYLDARNGERRQIQDAMYESALLKADPEAPAIVLEDPSWHPGVMGIVASKLLERYYLPVFIAAAGKGSVRSTPGISAVEGLRAAAPHLLRFG
ncbi:MAG TPA: DHH family phosphoesterase, partial [Trueperaceae bacterium]|nr:DHH family phosphoesterase [Trueperaceae bacterium]